MKSPLHARPGAGRLACRGFTLIEILVVLFIVSIMTGLTVVNLPSFTQTGDFDTETKRLKVLLELLRDEALVQANEYGFRPERGSYQFFVYNNLQQNWELLEGRPFGEREIKASIRLSLTIEGDELALGEDDSPPILILSSGEMTSFELEMRSQIDFDLVRTLEADGYGALKWRDEER
ncbi:MAG: type II secretion system minor pseudopilin GspH [Pseudomonadales bacterium]|jgi:general secretion pathway protein H